MWSNKMKTIKFPAALLSIALLLPNLFAQAPDSQDQAPPIPAAQLDSLLAPIALYPDPLLSQTLVAATYPLEIVQLQQWLTQNPNLKDQTLADAVQKQDWDPSIQAMSAFPSVVKQLADNIKWTTDLGNAFLDQEGDVMDAVQRMRAKAAAAGSLKSTEQQTVETKVVENKTVVVIQPASPQVVYVPVYNPVVVFGPPVYAYPPIYYPPPTYFAGGAAIRFGSGVSIGVWGGGGWGFGFGWGQRNVIINVNNRYFRYRNIPGRAYNPGPWRHDPRHRGGVPYRDRADKRRFGPAPRPVTPRPNPGKPGIPNTKPPATPDRPSVRPQPGTPDRGAGRPKPGKPDQPGVKPQPGKPGQPSGKPQPGKPDQPNGKPQPGKPDQPNGKPQPSKPDQPSAKPQPGKPDQTNGKPQPSKPDQPSAKPQPSKPDQPSAKPQPGKPDRPSGKPRQGKPDQTSGQPQSGARPDRGAGRPQNANNGRSRSGGVDRIGNREIPKTEAKTNSGAFDRAGETDGTKERANSKRAAASADAGR
jgi:Protein of unknown function (DUF3300)